MEKNKRTAEEAEAAKNLADIPVKRVNRELKYQGAILKVYQDTVQVTAMRQSGTISTTTARRLWWL